MIVDELSAEDRAIAANHYAVMAAMEHASVASFARFSLQLLALGAPADLLRDAHQAALDEVEHARTSYALANLFGKTNLGPDKLPGAVATLNVNLESFVRALVFEGCVGETLGAAEGKEAARYAVWPELSEVLAKIAADEERHAILAWRSLQWAIDVHGEAARDTAAHALADAMTFYSENPAVTQEVEAVGVLAAASLGALRRDVISTVVVPCAQALGIAV
jgi:hypothetical protein